jgi:hypothetical protein
MPADQIRYDILAQQALRGVVRTVMTDIAKNGLPGEHHFKITFATTAPGVQLPERVRAQYPDTMMIVLQHQFWDLKVDDDGFAVGLSFGGVPERIAVPFEAVMAFVDPAAQFALQFEVRDRQPAELPDAASEVPAATPAPAPTLTAVEPPDAPPAPEPPDEPKPDEKTGGAEVLRLDRFRKK